MKRKVTDWEKIFAKHIFGKELVYRIYKELSKLIEEDIQMTNKHIKNCLTSLASRKMHIKTTRRASLVAQWLRVCLPMQGTWVRALVREDPACRGATEPVSHGC